MYTVHIDVPAKKASSLIEALSQVTGKRLALPEDSPVTMSFQAAEITLVDALKGWLDGTVPQDCEVRIQKGNHVVKLGKFCRICQAEDGQPVRDVLLQCPEPSPSAREWCPLVFALQQADEEVEVKTQGRKKGAISPAAQP